MKQSVLKKEFKEKDIQRLRNLISGKYGDKTKIQVGYESKNISYKEGDTWEENGKLWTIEDGIKTSISKLDSIRKLSHFPLSCPNCNNHMKDTPLNRKMYSIHNMCSDCVFKMEGKLKLEGKFQQYKEDLMNNNKNSILDEALNILDEYIINSNSSFFTEDGDEETWKGGNINLEHIQQLKEYIKQQKDIKI